MSSRIDLDNEVSNSSVAQLFTLTDPEVKQLVNSLTSPLFSLPTTNQLNPSWMTIWPGCTSSLALVLQWLVWFADNLVLFSPSNWSLSLRILYNFNSTWCCLTCFHWCNGDIPALSFILIDNIFRRERRDTRELIPYHEPKVLLILQALGRVPWLLSVPWLQVFLVVSVILWPLSLWHAGSCAILLVLPPLGRTHWTFHTAWGLHKLQGSWGWLDEDQNRRWGFLRIASFGALALALLELTQPSPWWLQTTRK